MSSNPSENTGRHADTSEKNEYGREFAENPSITYHFTKYFKI